MPLDASYSCFAVPVISGLTVLGGTVVAVGCNCNGDGRGEGLLDPADDTSPTLPPVEGFGCLSVTACTGKGDVLLTKGEDDGLLIRAEAEGVAD